MQIVPSAMHQMHAAVMHCSRRRDNARACDGILGYSRNIKGKEKMKMKMKIKKRKINKKRKLTAKYDVR